MYVIVFLILVGIGLAYLVDKLFLSNRFHRIALPERDEILMLEREALTQLLKKSKMYEDLKEHYKVSRGRSMPRSIDTGAHVVQIGNRRNGKGILPSG